MAIKWHTEKRKITDLMGYENNPRQVKKDRFKQLAKNIDSVGFFGGIVINLDNVVLSGNQRIKVLLDKGFDEIEVMVPDRALSVEEEQEVNITANVIAGEWDADILSSAFSTDDLADWGLTDFDVGLADEKDLSGEADSPKEPKVKKCPACGELLS